VESRHVKQEQAKLKFDTPKNQGTKEELVNYQKLNLIAVYEK